MKLSLARLLFLLHAASWTCRRVNRMNSRFPWMRRCLLVILSSLQKLSILTTMMSQQSILSTARHSAISTFQIIRSQQVLYRFIKVLVMTCCLVWLSWSWSCNNFLAGNVCSRDVLVEMEIDDKVVDVDNNFMDPQLCATIACDIYQHLRASEVWILSPCISWMIGFALKVCSHWLHFIFGISG